MLIKGQCPVCKGKFSINIKKDDINNSHCKQCKKPFNRSLLGELIKTKTVAKCPICESGDFWRDKKFPKKLGIVLVIIGAVLVPFTYGMSFIILFLLDMIMWFLLDWRINCYKCESEFTGFSHNDNIKPFDLKLYEYYRENNAN